MTLTQAGGPITYHSVQKAIQSDNEWFFFYIYVCGSVVGGDCVLWGKPADERGSDPWREDRAHLWGASEADGSVAEGQWGRHLQHHRMACSEWYRHSQSVVGPCFCWDDILVVILRALYQNQFLHPIINRYTCRPQEKSIFAILLEWPRDGSVILNEPVVTQEHTRVRQDCCRTETTKIFMRSSANGGSIPLFVRH